MVAPRAPLLRWARPSGQLFSSLVPVLVLPPPPYSMAISSGLRSPLRGQVSVCWWVRDNPAQRARARAQVAALARRGTECLLYTSITYKFLYLLVLPNLVSHYVYLWTSVKKIPCNVNCFSTSKL